MITDDVHEPLVGLQAHLDSWVAQGLLTPEQADRIRLAEGAPGPAARVPAARNPLLTEALGYVGGVLVVVATVLLTARYWEDLALGARLGLVGAAALLLLVVGLLVGDGLPAGRGAAAREAGARLRSVTWALSAGALAGFLGLLSGDEVLDLHEERQALFVAGGTAVYGLLLWLRSRAALQQLVLLVALATAAASAVAWVSPSGPRQDSYFGLGVLAVGVLWLVLGLGGRLGPRLLVLAEGGFVAVLGAAMCQDSDWGRVLALAVVAAVILLAVRADELVLLGVGALGMLMVVPNVVNEWFPGAVAAPLALLLGGALLILAALRSLRRDSSTRPAARR